MVRACFNRIPPWGGPPPPSLWSLGVSLRWLSVRTCSGPGPGRSGRAWRGWRVSGPEQEHCPSRWRPLPGERAGQRVEARNGARTPPKTSRNGARSRPKPQKMEPKAIRNRRKWMPAALFLPVAFFFSGLDGPKWRKRSLHGSVNR